MTIARIGSNIVRVGGKVAEQISRPLLRWKMDDSTNYVSTIGQDVSIWQYDDDTGMLSQFVSGILNNTIYSYNYNTQESVGTSSVVYYDASAFSCFDDPKDWSISVWENRLQTANLVSGEQNYSHVMWFTFGEPGNIAIFHRNIADYAFGPPEPSTRGNINFFISYSASTGPPALDWRINVPEFNDISVWHLTTYVKDGSTLKLYVDASLKGSTAFPDVSISGVKRLELFGNQFGYSCWGLLDDFRLYDYALSESYITELYNYHQ